MTYDRHIVEELEVKNFRGIKEARLGGFTTINIFVGKNGTGKSSILEALYIALKLDEGLKYVIKRRGWFGLASIEALFYSDEEGISISIALGDKVQERVLIVPQVPQSIDIPVLKERGLDVRNLCMLHLDAKGVI